MQTLYDAAYIHVRCDASSPVENTKLNRVFSINETNHYNTSEFLKTSQVQIRRVDPGRSKQLPVASLVQSQAGKTYAARL